MVPIDSSRCFLQEMGIAGEILSTPGHSEDSISLCLDDGSIFVGDLNPLYELELHRGTTIGKSWDQLRSRNPKTIYYGHAPAVKMDESAAKQDIGKKRRDASQEHAFSVQGILDRMEIRGK